MERVDVDIEQTLAEVSPRDRIYRLAIACVDKVEEIPLVYKRAILTFYYWQEEGQDSRKFRRYVADFGLSESDVKEHLSLVWDEIYPAGIWNEFEEVLSRQGTSNRSIEPVIQEMHGEGMRGQEIFDALAPLGVKRDRIYGVIRPRK